SISAEQFPSEARRRASAAARARIDLTRPPLWSFTLLERTDTERVLLVNTHHIVSDRWSVGVLMQELAAEYAALVRGEPTPLPAVSSSYSDKIGQVEASTSDLELAKQLAYWRARFAGEVEDLVLPTDLPSNGE